MASAEVTGELIIGSILDKGASDVARHLTTHNTLDLILNLLLDWCKVTFLKECLFVIAVFFYSDCPLKQVNDWCK